MHASNMWLRLRKNKSRHLRGSQAKLSMASVHSSTLANILSAEEVCEQVHSFHLGLRRVGADPGCRNSSNSLSKSISCIVASSRKTLCFSMCRAAFVSLTYLPRDA